MDKIHRKAQAVGGNNHRPGNLRLIHQNRSGIHDAAVNNDCGQPAENTEGKGVSPQPAFFEKHPRQETDYAEAEHLPGRPRPLPEEKVGNKTRNGAHQKARFAAESNACDDGQSHNRLELGQHEKCHSAGDADSAEHGNNNQLSCLGLPAFKNQSKGQQSF